MSDLPDRPDRRSATRTIHAPADAVFAVLADPARHAEIDGTGRVRDASTGDPITAQGQVFRVRMFHENHVRGHYEMHNLVHAFDRPHLIAWRPGYLLDEDDAGGGLGFGGWTWRYDLVERGPDACEVTLTYDWSEVSQEARDRIGFPPFPDEHFATSLEHLAAFVEG